MRPLHARLADAKLELDGGNAGLWYDKYCGSWERRDGEWTLSSGSGRKTPKLAWLETVANDKPIGDAGLLAETTARVQRLTEARGGRFAIYTSESRFVTGLGRSHPVENGFAWHPTLGVPYLPGSSIKGLVRAWARSGAEPAPSETQLEHLLGGRTSACTAGHVVFLEALPIAPVRLEVDVMTPHYAGWTPGRPPGDWRAPVPVPFLTVASDTPFCFSIVPRGIEPGELDTVLAWLRDALLGAGAGAKTAVGYGRFVYDAARTDARRRELEQQRVAREQATRRAQLERTAEGRWLVQLENRPERDVYDLVRRHLDAAPIADAAERCAFARAVAQLSYLAQWRRGLKADPRTSAGPDRLKQLARLVDSIAATASDPAGRDTPP